MDQNGKQQNQGGTDQGRMNQTGMGQQAQQAQQAQQGQQPQQGMGQQGQQGMGQQGGMNQGGGQDWSAQIHEDMEVVDAQGQHVGTVDSCDDSQIKLTRSDSDTSQHRFVPTSQVASIEGERIKLSGGGAAMPN